MGSTSGSWVRGVITRLRASSRLGILVGLGARGMSAVLALGSTWMFARSLGPSEFGAFALAASIIGLVAPIAGLGLDQLAPREGTALRQRGEAALAMGFERRARHLTSSAALVGAFVVAGLAILNPFRWTQTTQIATIISSAGLVPLMVIRLHRGFFQGRLQATKGIVWESLAVNATLFTGAVIVWAAMPAPTSAAAAATNVAALLLCAALSALDLHRTRDAPPADFVAEESALRVGLTFASLSAGAFLLQQGDLLMLGVLGDEAEVGVYGAAVRVVAVILLFLLPVQHIMAPEIARAWSVGDRVRCERMARSAGRLSLGGALVAALSVALVGGLVMRSFGTGFGSGGALVRWLGLAQVAFLLFGTSQLVLIMTGHERDAAFILLGSLVVWSPVAWAAYSYAGVAGLAASKVLLAFAVSALGWLAVRRRNGLDIRPWLAGPKVSSPQPEVIEGSS